MRHDGKWDFEKELTHPSSEYWGTAFHKHGELWDGPLPSNRWIGVKFIIRNLNSKQVKLEMHYDKISNGNPDLLSDPNSWEKIGELIDDGNWPVSAKQDCIDSGDIDSDTVTGGKSTQIITEGGGVVFIRNTSIEKAQYKWFSIRQI